MAPSLAARSFRAVVTTSWSPQHLEKSLCLVRPWKTFRKWRRDSPRRERPSRWRVLKTRALRGLSFSAIPREPRGWARPLATLSKAAAALPIVPSRRLPGTSMALRERMDEASAAGAHPALAVFRPVWRICSNSGLAVPEWLAEAETFARQSDKRRQFDRWRHGQDSHGVVARREISRGREARRYSEPGLSRFWRHQR